MELYIEKDFLDDFYISVDTDNPTPPQEILINIFKNYGEVAKFIEISIDTFEDFESLKYENKYFAYLCEYHPPISIENIKEHFFKYSKCEQTIILTQQPQQWFEEAESRGALCLSFNDYESRIESIINKCTIKIDLSDHFVGWNKLNELKSIPNNELFISDPYVLKDSSNQKIDRNLIPLLKTLFNNSRSTIVKILTSNFAVRIETPDNILENVMYIHSKLNRVFANKSVKFKVISTHKSSGYRFDFHDRIIISNFYKIESGKGFNLIPFKQSDSILSAETVFDKFTYNRMKNLRKKYIGLEDHLKKHESYHFRYYPE